MGRKISQLTAASSMGNDDVIPIVQSGETKKITKSNTGFEVTSNKVTSLSSSSTNTQYPSAKVVYDQLATKQGTLTAGSNISITNGTISATDTTYNSFVGTDGTTAGTAGLVPAPTVSDTDKYLKSDGTWATVSGGGGATYTAGDNIDITNNVISVTGLTTGSDYVPLTITEIGTVYRVDSGVRAYEYELQNSAYYKYTADTTGTYTFKITGKVENVASNDIPIWFVGSDDSDFNVYSEGPYSVTYTDEVVTITTDENYRDIVFNFVDTDIVAPSLSVLQSVPGLLDGYVTKSGDTMTGKLIAPKLEVGETNNATGYCSCAIGERSIAAGMWSHASGYFANASANYSHAEGAYTEASGLMAHAEGRKTTAQRQAQHVEGEYNILDTTGANGTVKGEYIHIAGNGNSDLGTASYRSNAYTLDWSGNAWFAGDVYTGSSSGKNKDAGSKPLTTLSYTDIHSSAANYLVAKIDRLLQMLFKCDSL